ncbi:conserved hypothetical protein [Halorhabdus utahensis DSM 12940]|uniref:Uncharacterized protein n=1 Tax=Halorhabdus utahensis (strain DSM 12940 / JCM 11049 / AX-2) TaxID=519442 RepID=C7NQ03_HALUD|nr:hypothetical protein [Halorhabdus utahensis]ACV11747.1 conserved hypothetical protein [Halorhabdus utahensis DSM 12940]
MTTETNDENGQTRRDGGTDGGAVDGGPFTGCVGDGGQSRREGIPADVATDTSTATETAES